MRFLNGVTFLMTFHMITLLPQRWDVWLVLAACWGSAPAQSVLHQFPMIQIKYFVPSPPMMRSLTRMQPLEGEITVYLFLSLTYKYINDLDINVLIGRSTPTDSRSRKEGRVLIPWKGVPKGCSVFLEAYTCVLNGCSITEMQRFEFTCGLYESSSAGCGISNSTANIIGWGKTSI